MPTIDAGAASDRTAVRAILAAEGLPVAGLADAREVLVAREAGTVVGCCAIEIYADGGLLRSVAVTAPFRRTGLGRLLVEAAIGRAAALGLPALFLLTTSAERYFPRFGFEVVERGAVPDGVRQSVEFTSACPATATVMRKGLRD